MRHRPTDCYRFFKFLHFVSVYFGHCSSQHLKTLNNIERSIIKVRLQADFLKRCVNNNMVPPHLEGFARRKVYLHSERLLNHIVRANLLHARKIMLIEIKDCYSHLNVLRARSRSLSKNLSRSLPKNIWNNFCNLQSFCLLSYSLSESKRIDDKFEALVNRRTGTVCGNLKPIDYFCVVPPPFNPHRRLRSNVNNQRQSKSRFSFSPFPDNSLNIHVNIDPAKYILQIQLKNTDSVNTTR